MCVFFMLPHAASALEQITMHLRSNRVLELRGYGVCEVPNKMVPECFHMSCFIYYKLQP